MGHILLLGKSGSGKDSVAESLSEDFRYEKAILTTTRKPRTNEKEGKDYKFIKEDEFLSKVKENKFICYSCFNGWYYGIEKEELRRSENMVFVINPLWLTKFKGEGFEFKSFYIEVDSGIRILRQCKRTQNYKEIERRYYADERDFKEIKEMVDFVVDNNKELSECVDEILFDISYDNSFEFIESDYDD